MKFRLRGRRRDRNNRRRKNGIRKNIATKKKNHMNFHPRGVPVTGINKYSEIGNVSAVEMESGMQ